MAATPSAAGRNGRLKYADPRDLPSFPSVGLAPNGASASAAASLGWNNKTKIEAWQPSKSQGASKAALLANDSSPLEIWQPSTSAAGSKAATLAFRSDHTQEPYSMSGLDRQKSLRAAKGAMSTGRARAISSPLDAVPARERYPDSANAASNALSAATIAHRPSVKSGGVEIPFDEAGATPYARMNRDFYTSTPPVKLEVDEQNHEASLHASAVAMAKQMFIQQQKVVDAKKGTQSHAAASRATRGHDSSDDEDDHVQPTPRDATPNLQEAAYKLAQERLAKIHDDHMKQREYQEYYGKSGTMPRRFSMSKLRRRASSDGDIDDAMRSKQIRQQMSLFSSNLSKVDEEKRQKDRDAVLVAAQRNVKARLQGIDDKIYHDTGRTPPSRAAQWESKAHAAAEARSEARRDRNAGMVDLGGGKFMDPAAVNEIAAQRVQPILDEINAKAEKERERQAEMKEEEDERRRVAEKEKEREREIKDIERKLKNQEKDEERAKKQEAKEAARHQKEEGKAAKAEEKRLSREQKQTHKSKGKEVETLPTTSTSATSPANDDIVNAIDHTGGLPVTITTISANRPTTPQLDTTATTTTNPTAKDSATSPTSPTSKSPSKVRTWLRSHLGGRPRAKSSAADRQPGFIGGASLTKQPAAGSTSMTNLSNQEGSMRHVALAGRKEQQQQEQQTSEGTTPAPSTEPSGVPADMPKSSDKLLTEVDGIVAGTALNSNPGNSTTPHSHRKETSSTTAHDGDDDENKHPLTASASEAAHDKVSPANSTHDESSEIASMDTADVFKDVNEYPVTGLAPPRRMEDPAKPIRLSSSPNRETRFREELAD